MKTVLGTASLPLIAFLAAAFVAQPAYASDSILTSSVEKSDKESWSIMINSKGDCG